MAFDFGSAFVRVRADLEGFQKAVESEARAAGDAGGKAASAGVAKGFSASSVATKAFGVAVTGVFGLATKGALELDRAQATLQQRTGMTAEAANKAALAINAMSGRNLQGMGEITSTMVEVTTKLGLTGKAAEDATQGFLTFAQATGQDAAGAVAAFDDILDAWGLTAAEAVGIQDQLVASSQKYGGSVTDMQSALADMAPAMKALNADQDDAIGLMNLFAASGLDASAASMALKKAVQELKPGQSLDDLVKQISSIEDPTLRAQEAIKVFGSRGGVGLANALKPGVESLDEYVIRAEDVEGATEKAADASITFSDKVKLAFKGLGSAITGVLGPAGPLFTGLASMVSLGGTLGLDKVLRKIAGSSAVKTAAAFAGGAIGALVGAAMFVGEKLATALSSALSLLPGSAAVKGAATAAGVSVGGLLAAGIAAGIVAGAAIVVIALDDLNKRLVETGGTLYTVNGAFDIKGPVTLGERLGAAATQWAAFDGAARGAGLAATLAMALIIQAAKDTGVRLGPEFALAVTEGLAGEGDTMATGMAGLFGENTTDEARQRARTAGLLVGQQVPFGLAAGLTADEGRTAVEKGWTDLLALIKDSKSVTKQTAEAIGWLVGDTLADALTSKDPRVRTAAEAQKQLILDQLDNLNVRAGTISKEAAASIETGLKSEDKDIAAWAVSAYATTKGSVPTAAEMLGWSHAAVLAYAQGLIDYEDRVRDNAYKVAAAARGAFYATSPPGPESPLHFIDLWGYKTGESWADGLAKGVATAGGKLGTELGGLSGQFSSWEQAFTTTTGPDGRTTTTIGTLPTPVQAPTVSRGASLFRPGPSFDTMGALTLGASPAAAAAQPPGVSSLAAFAPGPQRTTTLNVYNPSPEPAGTSIRTRLLLAASGLGIGG